MTWNFASELAKYGPQSPVVATAGLSSSEASAYCRYVARSHYENFTVVSCFLPRRLRPHFEAVYAWCRWADDLADETDRGTELLAWWRWELHRCYEGTGTHPVSVGLRDAVRVHAIPMSHFEDLISAFEQDQVVTNYATGTQLLDYCRRSANPVGRIVLRLFGAYDEERAALSDAICTGLQLANFWQDVAGDAGIGRCYLPREDRERFDYVGPGFNRQFRDLLEYEVMWAREFFARGRALPALLPPRARYAVTLFLGGGEAILDAIEQQNYDVWPRRPVVSMRTKLHLMISNLPRLISR